MSAKRTIEYINCTALLIKSGQEQDPFVILEDNGKGAGQWANVTDQWEALSHRLRPCWPVFDRHSPML